jgi:hypothetical protein
VVLREISEVRAVKVAQVQLVVLKVTSDRPDPQVIKDYKVLKVDMVRPVIKE